MLKSRTQKVSEYRNGCCANAVCFVFGWLAVKKERARVKKYYQKLTRSFILMLLVEIPLQNILGSTWSNSLLSKGL